MNDGRLALLLPTFRFDETARHAINTAASLGGEDVSVYIGDNSCDPRKWEFLHAVAARSVNCRVYCHATNLGGGGNTSFLYAQQDHEFTATISDDDVYTPDYFLAGLEELRRNPECAVASGQLLYVTPEPSGLSVVAPGSIVEPTALRRIARYENAYNSITYGVFRRSAVQGFVDYLAHKPILPPFMDQFLTYTLLSFGHYVVHPDRRVFVYNNENWSSTNHTRNGAWHYEQAGLPGAFQSFNTLTWAVDALHFFNSRFRPAVLSDQEAQRIGAHLYHRFCGQFLSLVSQNTPAYLALLQHSAPGLHALKALLTCPADQTARILALFADLLDAFLPELATRFRIFVQGSLLLPAAAAPALLTA